jgi:hypothetical protein
LNSDKEIDFSGIDRRIVKIADDAFSGNLSLKSVTIPATTIEIGARAFSGCKNLSEVELYDTILETIGENAFLNTSVYSYKLPSTLTTIGDHAIGFVTSDDGYTVLPENSVETVEKIETSVEVTDEDGNKQYAADGETVLTSIQVTEQVKTTVVKVTISAASGSAASKYATANSISFSALATSTAEN